MELVEIDGPVVYLRLQGACGSCPSSLTTMTMGIKRRLQEKIPVRPNISYGSGSQPLTGRCSSKMLQFIRRAGLGTAYPGWIVPEHLMLATSCINGRCSLLVPYTGVGQTLSGLVSSDTC